MGTSSPSKSPNRCLSVWVQGAPYRAARSPRRRRSCTAAIRQCVKFHPTTGGASTIADVNASRAPSPDLGHSENSSGLLLRRLGGFCRRPQRPGVDAVRMQRKHRLVKRDCRRCPPDASVEVTEVTARFLDVARRAIRIEHAMTGDYCLWMQRLDFVECAEPFVPRRLVALREIEVRVVVDAIAGYDQPDGGHIQRS